MLLNLFLAFLALCGFSVALVFQTKIEFTATFDGEAGLFCAFCVAPVFGKLKINVSIALLKTDNYSIIYYKIFRNNKKIYKIGTKKITQDMFEKIKNKKNKQKINVIQFIELEKISLTLLLGMKDAFELVMLCGTFKIAFKTLFSKISKQNQVFAHSAFNSSGILINLEGILNVKIVNIIKYRFKKNKRRS